MRVVVNAAEFCRMITNVALFASDDDSLPMIAIVKLEATVGTLIATATDRYTVGQQRIELSPEVDKPKLGVVYVPTWTARQIAKVFRPVRAARTGRAFLTLMIESAAKSITVTTQGPWDEQTTMTFPVPVGYAGAPLTLPDIGKAVAGEPNAIMSFALSPVNVARFARVAVSVDRLAPIRFSFTGANKPISVQVGDNFRGVVMPVRIESVEATVWGDW